MTKEREGEEQGRVVADLEHLDTAKKEGIKRGEVGGGWENEKIKMKEDEKISK